MERTQVYLDLQRAASVDNRKEEKLDKPREKQPLRTGARNIHSSSSSELSSGESEHLFQLKQNSQTLTLCFIP